MKPAEIIELLLAKLSLPGGRHLYGVMGSHAQLDAFAAELAEARMADGGRFPTPLNVNRGILDAIPDEEFRKLTRDEAKRPEPTAAHVAQAFATFLRQHLRGKGVGRAGPPGTALRLSRGAEPAPHSRGGRRPGPASAARPARRPPRGDVSRPGRGQLHAADQPDCRQPPVGAARITMAKRNNTGTLFPNQTIVLPEGYYSGDKPNPNLRHSSSHLRELLRSRRRTTTSSSFQSADPTRAMRPQSIICTLSSGKKAHDPSAITSLTTPGPETSYLDPFCGSGGTALAALMEGRKAVAIDRSPAATFITKNHCTPIDTDQLRLAFNKVKGNPSEFDWLYETRCDRCGGKATTATRFTAKCSSAPAVCQRVPLFDCIEAEGRTGKGKSKKIKVCPTAIERGTRKRLAPVKQSSDKFPFLSVIYASPAASRPARTASQWLEE